MDKKLLDALNNVSEAITLLAESLDKKSGESKSSTGQALQKSDLDKQFKLLESGIQALQKDSKEILKNQKTIMDMASNKGDKSDKITGLSQDPGKKKAIKDGVSLILLIAVGVLAIGLAFKIVGQVNFASVIALAIALPLVAIAFEKISKLKGLSISIVLVTVAIALAITAASYILTNVQPVGLFQLFTAIMIGAMFGAISFGIGNFINGFAKANLSIFDIVKMSITIPLVMVSIAAAIVGSSYLLNKVQPVGLFQLFTSIFIAVAFGAIAFGIGKLLQGLKEIKNPAQAALIALVLPLVLVGIAAAILGSSYLLSKVKPIGLAQFFTSILISLIFIPISFALPFLSKAMEKINVGKILLLPLTMVLISAAILGSSYLLSMVQPIDWKLLFNIALQAITLSVVLIAISAGIYILDKAGLGPTKAFKYGLSIVIISAALMVSSLLLSYGDYTNIPPMGWSIAFAFAILVLSVPAIILGMVGLPIVFMGALGIVILAGAITAASYILSYIKPDFFYILADAFAYFFMQMSVAVAFAVRVIAPALKKFIDIVGASLIKFVKNILPPIVSAVGKFFREVVKPFMQFLVDSLPAIGKFITTIIEAVMPLIKMLIDGFKGLLEQIKSILETVGQVIEKIGNTIIGVINAISDGISKVIGTVGDAIAGIADKISKIIDSMSGFVNSIGNTITNVINSIVGGIEKLANVGFTDLVKAGANIVTFLGTVTAALIKFTNSDIKIDTMNTISKMLEQFNWFISGLNTVVSGNVKDAPALLAKGIDQLANSISKLNSSIDVEKLSALNKLTGGIILMSLMDPGQFEAVMSAFEKKSQIFVETINKLEGEAPPIAQGERPKVTQATTAVSVNKPVPDVTLKDILAEIQKITMNTGSMASDTSSIQKHIIDKDEKISLSTTGSGH